MFHAILAPTSSSFYHILILTDASKILYILRDNENSNFSIYLEFRLILKFKVSNKFVPTHNTVPIERKTHRNPSKKQSLCPTYLPKFVRFLVPRRGEKGDSKGEEVFCDIPSSVFHTSNGPPKRDRAQPVRLSTVIPTVTCALVQDTRSPIVTIPNTRYPSTLPVRRYHVSLSLSLSPLRPSSR